MLISLFYSYINFSQMLLLSVFRNSFDNCKDVN